MEDEKLKCVICKFPLEVLTRQTISVAVGSKPLTIQLQNNLPCLWLQTFESNKAPKVDLQISMFGTDEVFDFTDLEYLSTFQKGLHVFHVFFKIDLL